MDLLALDTQDPPAVDKAPDPAPEPAGAAPAPELESHEPPGETSAGPQGKRFENIREAGNRLFEKFGLKRKPGRPPHCIQCGLPETECPGHKDPNLSPNLFAGPAGPGPEIDRPRDPLLIRRSVTAIGKSVRKFADKIVYRKAVEATGDKEWAKTLQIETSASDEACEALGEVTDLVMKELGLESKYLPLASALIVVGTAGSQYCVVIKDLNKQIALKRAKEHPLK